jgi:hypothetical protein
MVSEKMLVWDDVDKVSHAMVRNRSVVLVVLLLSCLLTVITLWKCRQI